MWLVGFRTSPICSTRLRFGGVRAWYPPAMNISIFSLETSSGKKTALQNMCFAEFWRNIGSVPIYRTHILMRNEIRYFYLIKTWCKEAGLLPSTSRLGAATEKILTENPNYTAQIIIMNFYTSAITLKVTNNWYLPTYFQDVGTRT